MVAREKKISAPKCKAAAHQKSAVSAPKERHGRRKGQPRYE
jgi:hypothetical protein